MKNIIFHGPILNHVGINPLYKAENPSFFTVWKLKNRSACNALYICQYNMVYIIGTLPYLNETIDTSGIDVSWKPTAGQSNSSLIHQTGLEWRDDQYIYCEKYDEEFDTYSDNVDWGWSYRTSHTGDETRSERLFTTCDGVNWIFR